jgi:hypothetical protein
MHPRTATSERSTVLVLTDRAVDVIRNVVEANNLPLGAGLRIAAQPDDDGTPPFRAHLVEGPEHEDQVVEVEGARVFLDPIASPEFDDKILDAQLQPAGGVTFGIAQQEEVT